MLVTALAGFVEAVARLEETFCILFVDRVQSRNRRIVQSGHELAPGHGIIGYQLLDGRRFELDVRVLGFLTGPRHAAPGHHQEIRRLDELDSASSNGGPLFVSFWLSLFSTSQSHNRRHRVPKDVGVRIDNRVHDVLDGRRRSVGRVRPSFLPAAATGGRQNREAHEKRCREGSHRASCYTFPSAAAPTNGKRSNMLPNVVKVT
jgi:hypothetical protein